MNGPSQSTPVYVVDEASLTQLRDAVRERASFVNMTPPQRETAATVATELGRNQLRHARMGMCSVRVVRRASVCGIEIIASDRGMGIADPTQAIRGQLRGDASLRQGLASVLRLADEVDFDVRWGEGTTVRARHWSHPLPDRNECAIVARAYRSLAPSGDDAAVHRDGPLTIMALADGLGHGPQAREPASKAVQWVTSQRHKSDSLTAIISDCETVLAGTRGAVLGIARLDHGSGEGGGYLDYAGLGDIGLHVYGSFPDGSTYKQLRTAAGALGLASLPRRLTAQRLALPLDYALIMHSDGLARFDLEPTETMRHPIEVAHDLIMRHSLDHDDVLVLITRTLRQRA